MDSIRSRSKAVPLPPYRRQGGEAYNCCSFSTYVPDVGYWSASRPGRTLPRERTSSTIVFEAGWASELVWPQWLQEESFASTGDRNILSRFVDFYGNWQGGDAIQAKLDAIIFNPIASTIVKSHHCCVQCVRKTCSFKHSSCFMSQFIFPSHFSLRTPVFLMFY
jgi:hypothetical protein